MELLGLSASTMQSRSGSHGGKRSRAATSSRLEAATKKAKPASTKRPGPSSSTLDLPQSSPQEDKLAAQLVMEGMGGFTRQFRFHEKRRWLFDFAWTDLMMAVEYDGITGCRKSRHLTVKGFTADCEKLNEASILGWTVVRVTAPLMRDGIGIEQIKRAWMTKREIMEVAA